MDFLNNTNIVVGIGFVLFVGVLLYFNVPGMITAKLDERAVKIRRDLDEARALRLVRFWQGLEAEVKAERESGGAGA